ncbi:hypothetical protein PproGo58_21070 [Pseudomonas protegens]|nr:hypothetical protein PproGo58_21070 [Pseudomonas protegens]
MSSQVTFLLAGAAGAVAAVAAAPRDKLVVSSRAWTARLRGERAGSDLIVMVAVPSGGFGLTRVCRETRFEIRKKSRLCREKFPGGT